MAKVCLHFTGVRSDYGFVAETNLGTPMRVDNLIMPHGYIADIVAPDGGLFKVVPDKLQEYLIPGVGRAIKILTLIVDEGAMEGCSVDVRNEQIYMTLETAKRYGCA